MHLRNGQEILQTKSISRYDSFSYTARGNTWVNHEWLFGVIFFLVHSAFDYPGINILKCLIVASAFLIVLKSGKILGAGPRSTVFFCIFSAVVVRFRFFERPQIFSLLFSSLFFYILFSYRKEPGKKIWFLPVIMVFWANIHAACVFGIALTGLFIFIDFIEKRLSSSSKKPLIRTLEAQKSLYLLFLALISAAFINPNGYHVPAYLFKVTENLGAATPHEWREIADFSMFPLFWIYVSLLWLILILSAFKADLFHYALSAFLTFISIKYLRNMEFLAVGTPAIAALQLKRLFQTRPLKKYSRFLDGQWGNLALIGSVLLLMWTAFFSLYGENPRHYRFGTGINTDLFPAYEVPSFLKKHQVSGPLYNDSYFGGIIMWEWPSRPPVFFDGRLEVYEELRAEISRLGFHSILDKYGVQYAVVDNSWGVNPYRDYFLFNQQEWALVFYKDFYFLFLRRTPNHAQVIKEAECRFYRENKNFDDLTEEFLNNAVDEFSFQEQQHPDVLYNKQALGILYSRTGDYASAERKFLEALSIDSYRTENFYYLADLYLKTSRPDPAISYAEKGLSKERGHNPPGPYFIVGSAYMQKGRYEKSILNLKKAVGIKPDFFRAWEALSNVYQKSGQMKKAENIRKLLEKMKTDAWALHTENALRFLDQQNFAAAEQAFFRAIEVKPGEVQGYLNLARFYSDLNMTESCLNAIESARQVKPSLLPEECPSCGRSAD